MFFGFQLGFPVTVFIFDRFSGWKLSPAVNCRASGNLPSQANVAPVFIFSFVFVILTVG